MKENKDMDDNKPSDKQSKIQTWLGRRANAFAAYLSNKINPLSTSSKKRGFLLIGMMSAIVCFMLVVQAIRGNHSTQPIHVDSITVPKDIHTSEEVNEQSIIDQYNRMMEYKDLLERLQSSPNGMRVLDSLAIARPGLLDSVNAFIENYYSH